MNDLRIFENREFGQVRTSIILMAVQGQLQQLR